jgi:hypothetical protein
VLMAGASTILALDDGLCRTPIMGFNSWTVSQTVYGSI